MNHLTITDVRICPGDSGFLIDDGNTAILYDTGFGFTASQMAKRIRQILGNRPLNYIFLTHSHYDHALGSAGIGKYFPDVKIVASEYTKTVFQKDSARAIMGQMDRKAAARYGYAEAEDLSDALRVDITVADTEKIKCGDLEFIAVALPGHTKCSIGFYLAENKLLLAAETLGVYVGKEPYLSSYLVGYGLTMDSFQRVKALDVDAILIPHYGIVTDQEARRYLQESERSAVQTAELIKTALEAGQSHEQILRQLTAQLYQQHIVPVYPLDAFQLNTSIMIRLIEAELLNN